MRLRFLAFSFATLTLLGCPPPEATSKVDTVLDADALVIEGTTDEEQNWLARLESDDAPPGEYFSFVSTTRPTDVSGLATFDPGPCRGTCRVPGLGLFRGYAKLERQGPLRLQADEYAEAPEMQPATSMYFVLARRGTTTGSVRITGLVSIEGNAGCGGSNPDPPTLVTSTLRR